MVRGSWLVLRVPNPPVLAFDSRRVRSSPAAAPMVRIRPIPFRMLLVAFTGVWLCAGLAVAADQPTWVEIHSTYFTVITDGGEKKGREIALRFEQMRTVFANLLTKERLNQPQPLTILAFRDDK